MEKATKALQAGWMVLSGIAAVMATVGAYKAGLPMYLVALICLGCTAAMLVGLAAALLVTDHIVSKREDRREAARVADRLERLLRAGHRKMTVAQLTGVWLDEGFTDERTQLYVHNAHLRAVKKLVALGVIRGDHAAGEAPIASTLVSTEDAVNLFRSKAA